MATSTFLRALIRTALQRLTHRRGTTASQRPSAHRKARLGLETLEDRFMPAVFNVNTLADTLAVNLTTGQDATGHVSLRSALQAANATPGGNTINLTLPGTYRVTRFGTPGEVDGLAGEFAILPTGGDLTIDNTSGGTIAVDARGHNRVFDVNPGDATTTFNVVFQGITIQHGAATDAANPDSLNASGGGIRTQGAANLELDNVIVTNNSVTADGGGIGQEGTNNTGTLTLNNSTISSNHAGDAGGGIDTDGIGLVTVNGGAINFNTTVNQGAGIWLDGGNAPLEMTGVTVNGNTAFAGATGAIGNAGNGAVTITNCIVENNFSGSTGGGFGDENMLGNLTITGSQFLNNVALTSGGAIQAGGNGTTVTITDTVIEGNSAQVAGGGVFLTGGTAMITNTALRDNNANVGGGIEDEAMALTLNTVTLNGNRALGTNGGNNNGVSTGGAGGGLQAGGGGAASTVAIFNSLFVDNASVSNTNASGGAILDTAGTLVINNSEFTGNSTSGSGGAVYDFNQSATLNVVNTTFANNSAGINGGAIATVNASFTNSTFTGNRAGTNGGAIDGSGNLVFVADTINANTAGALGGGIRNFSGTLSFTNTIIAQNAAGSLGNDVYAFLQQFTDHGGNIVGDQGGAAGLNQNTDQIGVNPKLGPLQNNGGPTVGADGDSITLQTEALLSGSAAIGKGVAAGQLLTDERGFVRPSAIFTTLPDVGAFQSQPAAAQKLSTVPSNGDVNPYGVAFVPANFPSGGVLQPGDLLISNFNNAGNTQGTGTTITRLTQQGQTSTFFTSALPGLSNALGILQAGFVVVGNVPNVNGTPAAGALQFLDKNGNVVLTLTDPLINGPWSLTIANDTGDTAQFFVSNVLSGTVVRFNLLIQKGQISVTSKFQIASGYAHRLDNAAFVVGPAGLAYDPVTLRLYVASSADNEIFYIPFANTRVGDSGQGVVAVNDPTHLHGPLGLLLLPNGNLLTANEDAQNVDPNQPSELVEYAVAGTPVTATFVGQFAVDAANGGAFGIGLTIANGQFRLAAVDDNVPNVTIWSNETNTPLQDLTLVHTSDPYQLVVNTPNPGNATLTCTATVISQLTEVDQKFGLTYTGNFFQGSFGINGVWLQSTNGSNAANGGWYFLLTDGTLHQWDGSIKKTTATTSPMVATLTPTVYYNPLQLPAAGVASTAYTTEQALDLVFTGNLFQNAFGINGKWLRSGNGNNAANGGWYFLLPDGTLHQWDGGGSSATANTSPIVAALNSTYWQVPSLLYSAAPPQMSLAGINAAFLGNSNVLQLSGYRNFVGSFGVQVAISDGTTTTTQFFLVNVTDQAPTLATVPDQTVPHTGTVTVTLTATDPDPNETLTLGAKAFANTLQTRAYTLQQQLALSYTGNYFQSSYGIKGMWLQSTNGSNAANGGWYFLLSDGTLHQWDGVSNKTTAVNSPIVATLDGTYYANPMNLLNATPTPAPANLTSTITGNTLTVGNFGGFTGDLLVLTTVSDGILSSTMSFRIHVT